MPPVPNGTIEASGRMAEPEEDGKAYLEVPVDLP